MKEPESMKHYQRLLAQKAQNPLTGEVTPKHTELLRLEEQARQQGIGLWDRAFDWIGY
ncbi:hypothetical protein HanHA300_Chr01g0007241 [Helianthus annuus]|nr:hypothetical protein HanHA300_Chr01g0007241 [Helianthus annuus]KAJ0625998.1 hypothetical protein HanHA89_Chr01g0007941 [Helianthus annuus]KAJ0807779.1 hypothetical protein HanLR1_Chr00c1086g0789911 [Helianthus annuus]